MNTEVWAPVCAYTHVLAALAVLAAPFVTRYALRIASNAAGRSRRRAEYRRNWERLTS